MNFEVGDLYWTQLSMWDYSKDENVDVYSDTGFHYELLITTAIVNDKHRKVRNVKKGEISDEQLQLLIPQKGHNWCRVMGNRKDLV